MLKRILATTLLCALAITAQASDVDGLIVKKSPHGATATMDRLENILKERGITIATRWDHQEGAQNVDIELRPTQLILFGNPKVGSHFFTSKQTAGIDLPMKALVWEDAQGRVWLGYNDPQYLAARHGIDDRDETVQTMSKALDALTDAAIAR